MAARRRDRPNVCVVGAQRAGAPAKELCALCAAAAVYICVAADVPLRNWTRPAGHRPACLLACLPSRLIVRPPS